MDSKTIRMAIFRAAGAVFTVGALALTVAGANAQVVSTPYGNLPAGATPINLSPSAPYTLNPFNTNTQDYSVFGGTNGNPYGGVGSANLYGIGGYGGFGGFGGYDTGFGSPLGGFFGIPLGGTQLGSGLTFLDGPYTGGYALLGPNGTTIVDPYAGYNPYANPYYMNTRSANNGSDPANGSHTGNGSDSKDRAPLSLSQSLAVQRGRNFDLTVGWRGDPSRIANMKVTLLNRYHLPVAQQVTEGAAPARFAANANTFAARYYRVEVQYADGATAEVILSLKSAVK